MDFTNINDPAGIKALLDQLRQSQAWQDSVASANPSDPAPNSGTQSQVHVLSHEAQASQPSTSVASLLSQLQASPSFSSADVGSSTELHDGGPSTGASRSVDYVSEQGGGNVSLVPATLPSSARKQDVRWLSFQQALPHLARLGEEPSFASVVAQLKQEQADLETQLFEERKAIYQKHEEKVKIARTRANIVGGLSRHEADMMMDAFRKELRRFDLERALTAWDGLVTKQQAALEGLSVPGMFATDAKVDRERQQRIVQVLEGIAGGGP